jgi:hypothetical protein
MTITDLFPSTLEDGNVDPEVKKPGFLGKMRDLAGGLGDRVPQEHKDRANEHYDRAKTFLADEYFPEERRDQFIYRGKKVGHAS